ncbi:hypothetical protein SAMN05216293_3631 [Flagellimonas taeanensis]|uniref:Uncharacterized protein n=1 Tax=Flagellimonas taeanensis TaxID=1005926 RepID=A0A1M7B9J1_9FLAO|nr:hypothetical protein SAMN05216293_3631 [Allomuricauda taeanensis]
MCYNISATIRYKNKKIQRNLMIFGTLEVGTFYRFFL